jgi:hypothetical protein
LIVQPVPTQPDKVQETSTESAFTTFTTFQYQLYQATEFQAIFTKSFISNPCVVEAILSNQPVGVAVATTVVVASVFSFATIKATSNIPCPLHSFSSFTIEFDSIASFVLFGTTPYVLCTIIFDLSVDISHQPFLFSIVTDL